MIERQRGLKATLLPRIRTWTGRASAPRPRLLSVVAALSVALVGAGSAAARIDIDRQRLESPQLSRIARGPAYIADTVLRTTPSRAAYWGGATTASTGETVTIYVSDAYPQDPATAQKWANFLARLVHGSELAKLTVYLAPISQVQSVCGTDALGCYSPATQSLVAPGDDPAADTSAEAVVTHEYGHHVAANRSNAPWSAENYGTKRWASYEQVCSKTRAGDLFPGAETQPDYRLNPGEAFAETYRVLNERRTGQAETAWDVVSQTLYPDTTALAVLQQDVTQPWTGATTVRSSGSVSARTRSRTTSVATSLDGTLRVTLRAPARARVSLDVVGSSGTRLGHAATTAASRTRTVSATVCGQRSVKLRVNRVSGSGTYRLTISRP
ncbi:MAG TPA: hypothetical protein VF101_15120 [Gaiellaceae bacterium]